MADAADCAELNNSCGEAIHDPARFTEARVQSIWAKTVSDISRDIRLVHTKDGLLVGYFIVRPRKPVPTTIGVRGRVHPHHENQGIASHLMSWAESRALEELPNSPSTAKVVMQAWFFEPHAATQKFLTEWGFLPERYFLTMDLIFGEPLVEPPLLPAGIELRPYDPEAHFSAVSRADWESFGGQWGMDAGSAEEYEAEFARNMVEDERYDPTSWFVAWDKEEIAGLCLCKSEAPHDADRGFVETLAVLPPWRGQGLGRYLLLPAFAHYKARGKGGVTLHVDAENPTNASRLYEGVGMSVKEQNNAYRKILRAGSST